MNGYQIVMWVASGVMVAALLVLIVILLFDRHQVVELGHDDAAD